MVSFLTYLALLLTFRDSIIARPRADPQERPLLAWYQKHHIRGMDNNPDVLKTSNVCGFGSMEYGTVMLTHLTGSTGSSLSGFDSAHYRTLLPLRPEL